MSVRRFGVMLAGLFVLALGLRLYVVFAAADVPVMKFPVMDGRQYLAWGAEVAGGDVLGRGRGVFYQAPLYPYFLGACRAAFGEGLAAVRVVQCVFGAASCVMIAVAGRRVWSWRVGLMAGGSLALYPPAVFFDVIVQKASIGNLFTCGVVLLTAMIATGARVGGRGRVWPIVAALGVVQGLLMLTREETVLLAPVLAGVVWFSLSQGRKSSERPKVVGASGAARNPPPTPSLGEGALRRRIASLAAFGLGLAVVLAPVVIRNYVVGGELVLTTSQAGSNFYIGNNADADGTYKPLRAGRSNTPWEGKDARDLAERALGRALTAREVSRYWFGRAFEFMRSRPGAWAKLMCRKAHLLVNWYEVADSEDLYRFEQRVPVLRWIGATLHMGVLAPVGIAGVVVVMCGAVCRGAWGRASPGKAMPLVAILLTLVLGILAFYVFARYRYPVVPLLALFGAAAPGLMVSAWRAGRRVWVVGAAVAAGLVAIPANSTIYPRDAQAVAWSINDGAAYAGVKQWDAAARVYEEGLARFPQQMILHANLGAACLEMERFDDAVGHLRRAQELAPGDPFLMLVLGRALEKQGDAAGAVVWLQNSLAGYPDEPEALAALERIRRALGERGYRGVTLLAEKTRFPGDREKAIALAWWMATVPDPTYADGAEALRVLEPIMTEAPEARMLDALGAAHATMGEFAKAVEYATRAAAKARETGDEEFARRIEARLETYRGERRYVE